jgi:hypothetical protein
MLSQQGFLCSLFDGHDIKELSMYLVFAGYGYYPSGGANDYVDSFDDFNKAEDCAEETIEPHQGPEWSHVFNTETKKIVGTYYNS